MVYFAILVSDCRLMVDEPNFRVPLSRSTLLEPTTAVDGS